MNLDLDTGLIIIHGSGSTVGSGRKQHYTTTATTRPTSMLFSSEGLQFEASGPLAAVASHAADSWMKKNHLIQLPRPVR